MSKQERERGTQGMKVGGRLGVTQRTGLAAAFTYFL